MAIKKFFIKSSNDLISRELEKLQTKINCLETSSDKVSKKRKVKKHAVYSPAVEVDAKVVEFEYDDDMFN